MRQHTLKRNQSGAALVVGLIMLLVLTVLGVSGMNTTVVERRMANNMQVTQNAYQSSQTGIERAINVGAFNTGVPVVVPNAEIAPGSGNFVATTTTFVEATIAPNSSIGDGGFLAYHFTIVSNGTSASNAASNQVQEFFVEGPAGLGQ
ncbi:MAG: pilus assembly PilX N-terminal domain-containing protein [Pseudomonadota bacterium]